MKPLVLRGSPPAPRRVVMRSEFPWESQACQYPPTGDGLVYFAGGTPRMTVDCLLSFGSDQKLWGVLNHYPKAAPPLQERGSINIIVDPTKQRRGVATSLLTEAQARWKIDLSRQQTTEAGQNFLAAYCADLIDESRAGTCDDE